MADVGFKHKLAAIPCADVEGDSRLMDDTENYKKDDFSTTWIDGDMLG